MNSKAETSRSPVVDSMLLLVSLVMLVGGIGAYYYFQDMANTPVRVGALIVWTVISAWVAGQSTQGATLYRFLRESDIERRKVIWPTHQETVQTSLMVCVVTVLISLFLAGVDWLLGALVRSLLGGG
jgi:preprotein translocase subunit SecE